MVFRLKYYRVKKGLSHRELAELSGVNEQTIVALENNKTDVSAAICYATNNSNAKNIILGELLRSHCASGQPFPYGIYKSNKIYLHFDGCGISTLFQILKYCGLTYQEHNETKTSDFIYCSRGAE